MGISTEWVSILKGEAPNAFSQKLDAPNLQGAFIDGQIQLMKSDALRTWDQFFKVQYAIPIERLLKQGPDTMIVVLSFDDYTHVPASKAMTQTKRRSQTVPLQFEETDVLPAVCPPDWSGAMANRVFKTKVIFKILEVLPTLLNIRGRQRVIVDFMNEPVEFSTFGSMGSMIVGGAKGCFMRKMPNFPGIGESDCKFPRWIDYICRQHPHQAVDVIVESTDSDYIMIGMLHYEKQVKALSAQRRLSVGRMILHRIACHGKEHAAGEQQQQNGAKGKRKRGDGNAVSNNKRQPRSFEYVHIPLLYEIMALICQKIFSGPFPIGSLVSVIALAGTDFSRPTPQLGAHRMWENLPLLLSNKASKKMELVTCQEDDEMQIDLDSMCNKLIAGIYSIVWSAHCSGWDQKTFGSIRSCIMQSKLGEKTKLMFPSQETILTTVKNIAWTIKYWEAACMGDMSLCPDPVHAEFGFALDSKGRPAWADLV